MCEHAIYCLLINRLHRSERILSCWCQREDPSTLVLWVSFTVDEPKILESLEPLHQTSSSTIHSGEEPLARVDSRVYHVHESICASSEAKWSKDMLPCIPQNVYQLEQRVHKLCANHRWYSYDSGHFTQVTYYCKRKTRKSFIQALWHISTFRAAS